MGQDRGGAHVAMGEGEKRSDGEGTAGASAARHLGPVRVPQKGSTFFR